MFHTGFLPGGAIPGGPDGAGEDSSKARHVRAVFFVGRLLLDIRVCVTVICHAVSVSKSRSHR
jgi:hypothetical protein